MIVHLTATPGVQNGAGDSSTERPILFSAPMVRAILEGRKTQTRRAVKPQPIGGESITDAYGNWHVGRLRDSENAFRPIRCPYGEPRDFLWVRETFNFSPARGVQYRADGGELPAGWKWTPSIHIPRKLSRINLEVTRVRCERLHEISAKDILAEGAVLRAHDDQFGHNPVSAFDGKVYLDLLTLWAAAWQKINGKASWDANPWVWCVEFKPLELSRSAMQETETTA